MCTYCGTPEGTVSQRQGNGCGLNQFGASFVETTAIGTKRFGDKKGNKGSSQTGISSLQGITRWTGPGEGETQDSRPEQISCKPRENGLVVAHLLSSSCLLGVFI